MATKASKKRKTGFCLVGACEGFQPKSASGNAMKTCSFWETCACDCHKQVTEMFEAAGLDRIPVDNPEYSPPQNPYWMPTAEEKAAEKLREKEQSQPVIETAIALESAGAPSITMPVTRDGRKPKGQLEREVFNAIRKIQTEKPDEMVTPVLIAETINEKKPPSTGAIGAVFERWVRLGFCVIEKKPVRFVRFCSDPTWDKLIELKAKAQAEKEVAKRKVKVGIR